MTTEQWRRLAITASVVGLTAGTVWLLLHGTRGAEIANVLALPVAVVGAVVTIGAMPNSGTDKPQARTPTPTFEPLPQSYDRPGEGRSLPTNSDAATKTGGKAPSVWPIFITAILAGGLTLVVTLLLMPGQPDGQTTVTYSPERPPAGALPTGGPANFAPSFEASAANLVFEQYMNGLARHDMPALQGATCPKLRSSLHGFYLNGYLVGNWELLPYDIAPKTDYVTVQARVSRLSPTGSPAGEVVYSWYVERGDHGSYYVCGFLDDNGHNN